METTDTDTHHMTRARIASAFGGATVYDLPLGTAAVRATASRMV